MPKYEDYLIMEALGDLDDNPSDDNSSSNKEAVAIPFDSAEEVLYDMSIEYQQEKTWNQSISRK